MHLDYTLEDILGILGHPPVEGQTDEVIQAMASLELAKPGDISFLANAKYRAQLPGCRASVILIPEDYPKTVPAKNQVFLRVSNPSRALALLCEAVEKKLFPHPEPGIDPTAVIHPTAKIASTAHIGPFCYIQKEASIGEGAILTSYNFVGTGASIGEYSKLLPHASVMNYCQVGKRNNIHPQAIIGSDGFGYSSVQGVHTKEPQVGIAVLEDDVDVGAGSTIDRARFSETRIGAGTKIDNLVQIAHNVTVGKNCFLVAQVGVAGSVVIEDNVILGGQVGIAGHLRIGAGSTIGAQSGVNRNIQPNSFMAGSPPLPFEDFARVEVSKKRLPELFKRVQLLEEARSQELMH